MIKRGIAQVARDTQATCLGDVQELRLDAVDVGMALAPVRLTSSTFVPWRRFSWVAPASDFVLENALAEKFLPAIVQLVEKQFHPVRKSKTGRVAAARGG